MKHIKNIILLIPFVLTSCKFRGDLPLIKNGDLLYTASEEFMNQVRVVEKVETIDTLIKADETFIFYISSSQCHACSTFNPILSEVMKNNNLEIYYIDVFAKPNVYLTLCQMYPSYFLTIVATPHIYLVDGQNGTLDIENRFYETSILFENTLKKHFYETNIYNFQELNNLKSFIADNDNLLTMFYDQTNNDAVNFYQDEIYPNILQSTKNIALINYAMLDTNSQSAFKNFFQVDEKTSLNFYLYHQGQLEQEVAYSSMTQEEIKTLINNYLQ